MANRRFSYAYNKYVTTPDDLQGLIAYSLYKRAKVTYLQNYNKDYGKDADDVQIHDWSTDHSTDDMVTLFKREAAELVDRYRQLEIIKAKPQLREVIEKEILGTIQVNISSLTGNKAFTSNIFAGLIAALIWTVLAGLLYVGLRVLGTPDFLRLINQPRDSVESLGRR